MNPNLIHCRLLAQIVARYLIIIRCLIVVVMPDGLNLLYKLVTER